MKLKPLSYKTKRYPEEVRLLSSLKHNSISLDELEKKEYVFKGEWELLKVMRGLIKDVKKEWLVCVVIFSLSTAQKTVLFKIMVRHRRLIHVTKKDLVKLKK